ncbi:hypothetical protein Q3304_08665 [Clostridioides sp. GD02377]|uniref:hypothetical protein n=1 Tax=unclassified Clostridioides TaxID=2635829 RepID=UPI0038A86932
MNDTIEKKEIIKQVKNLGWNKIFLDYKNGFRGAILRVKKEDGKSINMVISEENAYTITDLQGMFSASDLLKYVLKNEKIDINFPNRIQGAEIIATVKNEDEVEFNESSVYKYKLTNDSKESIKVHLLAIYNIIEEETILDLEDFYKESLS